MEPIQIHHRRTALVAIDLQRGIVARQTAPHPAAQVVVNTARLLTIARQRGLFVVLVNVDYASDGGDRVSRPCDQPAPPGAFSADWAALVPELHAQPTDYRITKHQWGAFYGTDLDLQLRRRGIDTLILTGIATNIGVETTARNASERNYAQIFVEDAMTALSAAEHQMSVSTILPRLGAVRSTAEVAAALEKREP
ncbi:MAG: hydrolase [Gammaproteobacteria bacterium]|nr:hydrolase [Gammaproteobacteria bacterium]